MDIVLTTFNAKFAHASFGLRYLLANLGPLQPRADLLELDLSVAPLDAVERLLALNPKIVGFGVYIWNAELTLATVELLRALRPKIHVVVGGPEVSHEIEDQALCRLADVVVVGEGEVAFADVCTRLLAGEAVPKIIQGGLPSLPTLTLPYALYTDDDLARRVIYVEASRGCPYRCAFCLSALDRGVRRFDEGAVLDALDAMYRRGLRSFKFVDRTFNLSIPTCERILSFFLERVDADLFVHFELVPDRLPDALKGLIAAFPPGVLQFEIGIQTLDPEVAARIDRRYEPGMIEANLRWLRASSGAHLHADLIVGLPGETLERFGEGFDRLLGWGPHEIQVGILKRLRGAPIARHTEAYGMVYSPRPPYEVLETSAIPFAQMLALKRFARFWGMLANEGNYPNLLALLLRQDAPFASFFAVSESLGRRFGRAHAISAARMIDALFDEALAAGHDREVVGRAVVADLVHAGRLPIPDAYRPFATDEERRMRGPSRSGRGAHARQEAHGSRGHATA